MIVSMPDTRVVTVLPGNPRVGGAPLGPRLPPTICRRLAYVNGAPGSLRFTARQNKPMLSENSPTLYCVPERFRLILFCKRAVSSRRGLARLRSMARQLPQKNTGTDAPRRLPTERRGAFFFCVKAFLFGQQEGVMSISRRRILKSTGGGLAGILATGVAPYHFVRNIAKAAEGDTIKVGILHSLSGTIAIIESSLHNAELLAIEEINAKGGVLGKKIQPVVEDPQSMVQVFAEKAKRLLLEEKVVAVLGCYTSASRQSVLPVFEENNGVLLYPTLYEAQECSKNCFYTGAVPNQQLDDFVPWIINTLGRKKFYLIGANYIYPKETNREVKALLQKHGGTTVAEEYSPLGSTEFSTNINKIASSGCDIVFSDLVGDQIVAFYKQFKEFGITAKDIPICTPITTEQEIAAMGAENAIGHYTSFNYFQSVDTPQNKSFVERYKAKYGKDAVTNAVMEAAYFQTYFLAQAIAKVKSTDADALIFDGLPGQEFLAPQGKVKIDEKNHHTWLWARIGKANEQGQFDVVWKSEDWIRPQPWVPYLYPNKNCDFTDKRVLDRVKKPWSQEKNRSGTIDL